MERRWRGCLGCLGVAFLMVLLIWLLVTVRTMGVVGIAVLPIEGVLLGGESESALTMDVTGARTIAKLVREAAQDRRVRALVVRIDSPGGSAAAAQEMFLSIRYFKDRTGRPVIAAMGDLAASGGYYVATAADKIYALPSTLTGSIGVIWQSVNMEKLLAQFGIKPETLKAGRFKDTGSFFRSLTPQERELLQRLLNDVHEQFIADVAKGRKLPLDKVKAIADGRILTGRQAKRLGLVDELGTLDDALIDARRQANLPSTAPAWTLEQRRGIMERLLGTDALRPFPSSLVTEPLLLHTDGRLGIGLAALLWQGMTNLR